MAAPQSYNFFGMAPAQQQAPVDPNVLALQMYNNPTSSQSAPGGNAGMGSINPQMLAQMMMKQPPSPAAMNPSGAEGMGPYQLPWLNGGGNG